MATAQQATRRIEGRGRAVLAVLAGLASGCVVSPVPQPPPMAPDIGNVTIVVDACPQCDQQVVELRGSAGAVTGEGVELWVVDLDSAAPPHTYPVAEDGSFVVMLEGSSGHVFRLQTRRDEQRSEPVDIVDAGDGRVGLAPHALEPCFALDPRFELDFGQRTGPRSIDLTNDCGQTLDIELRLRVASAAFEIDGAPSSLAAHENGVVTVSRPAGMPAGLAEEIVFIEAVAPAGVRDRRAVTLIATGTGD